MGISVIAALTPPSPPATQGNKTNATPAADEGAFGGVYAQAMGQHAKSKEGHQEGTSEKNEETPANTAQAVDPATEAAAASLLPPELAALLANPQTQQTSSNGVGNDDAAAPADIIASTDAAQEDTPIAQLLGGLLQPNGRQATPESTSQGSNDTALPAAPGEIANQMLSMLRQGQAASNARSDAAPASDEALGALGLQGRGPAEKGDTSANIAAAGEESGKSFTSALTQASQAQASQTASPVVREERIETPVGQTRWHQDFGEKVVYLAKADVKSAEISINPPHLGPLQISLQITGDQATASFGSPHVEVRQAIEDALPRLREMLASSGINLGDANVGSQAFRQNNDSGQTASGHGGRFGSEPAILAGDTVSSGGQSVVQPLNRGRGLVDLFA